MSEWVTVTLKVIDVLDRLGISYLIGGSAASIVHGIVRSTVDSDLLADIQPEHVPKLISDLEGEFYLDSESIHTAISTHSSFNLIHQSTMFKVDIFIPKKRPFERSELTRRVEKVIARDPQRTAWIASAEDIILAKLEWFRIGNEVSERQWRDVLGVMKTQAGLLDVAYMRDMATTLAISDLLLRAIEESTK